MIGYKTIDQFDIEDCDYFLKSNPDSPYTNMVEQKKKESIRIDRIVNKRVWPILFISFVILVVLVITTRYLAPYCIYLWGYDNGFLVCGPIVLCISILCFISAVVYVAIRVNRVIKEIPPIRYTPRKRRCVRRKMILSNPMVIASFIFVFFISILFIRSSGYWNSAHRWGNCLIKGKNIFSKHGVLITSKDDVYTEGQMHKYLDYDACNLYAVVDKKTQEEMMVYIVWEWADSNQLYAFERDHANGVSYTISKMVFIDKDGYTQKIVDYPGEYVRLINGSRKYERNMQEIPGNSYRAIYYANGIYMNYLGYTIPDNDINHYKLYENLP